MEPNTMQRPGFGSDRSGQGAGKTKKYIEFQLDPATLKEIEALARKTGCTPFEMSVILLEEGLSNASGAGVSAV